jgi:hypothetical protein
MDFMTLLQNFGLPVATAAFFIYMFVQQAKEHKDDLKNIAVQAVKSADAGTEAIKDATATLEKNNTALSRVEVVLSRREGQNNGMANGN